MPALEGLGVSKHPYLTYRDDSGNQLFGWANRLRSSHIREGAGGCCFTCGDDMEMLRMKGFPLDRMISRGSGQRGGFIVSNRPIVSVEPKGKDLLQIK